MRTRAGGYVLILVMVAMVVLMAMGSALIQHFAVAEARAMEENLAASRAHLAMTGFVRYLVHRSQRLTFANDASKITGLRDMLAELNGVSLNNSRAIQTEAATQINTAPLAWRVPVTLDYPNAVSNGVVYRIRVRIDLIDALAGTDNGNLRLELTLAEPLLATGETLLPVLAGLPGRVPGLSYAFNTVATSSGRITRATY